MGTWMLQLPMPGLVYVLEEYLFTEGDDFFIETYPINYNLDPHFRIMFPLITHNQHQTLTELTSDRKLQNKITKSFMSRDNILFTRTLLQHQTYCIHKATLPRVLLYTASKENQQVPK